jgi:hypothetical protein
MRALETVDISVVYFCIPSLEDSCDEWTHGLCLEQKHSRYLYLVLIFMSLIPVFRLYFSSKHQPFALPFKRHYCSLLVLFRSHWSVYLQLLIRTNMNWFVSLYNLYKTEGTLISVKKWSLQDQFIMFEYWLCEIYCIVLTVPLYVSYFVQKYEV